MHNVPKYARSCTGCNVSAVSKGVKEVRMLRCSNCETLYCSVACQKADWKLRHKAICLVHTQNLRQEGTLAQPASAALGVAFRLYLDHIYYEMDIYLPLMYRTHRADSTYHEENVVSLVFEYDATISDLRHQFRLVSSQAIPYSEMEYGELNPEEHTHEVLEDHQFLKDNKTTHRATVWQKFTARSVLCHANGNWEEVILHTPDRDHQREPGPDAAPMPRSLNWEAGLRRQLSLPKPKTSDAIFISYLKWMEKEDPEWSDAHQAWMALQNPTWVKEASKHVLWMVKDTLRMHEYCRAEKFEKRWLEGGKS
ncbi:hypothetical protein RQP46_007129 [Phenoliferia psychrophenolica]